MCMSSPKVPDVKKITPPPPPEPTPELKAPEGVKRTGAAGQKAKRSGTRGLRIDLAVAQPGGRGLNIPSA